MSEKLFITIAHKFLSESIFSSWKHYEEMIHHIFEKYLLLSFFFYFQPFLYFLYIFAPLTLSYWPLYTRPCSLQLSISRRWLLHFILWRRYKRWSRKTYHDRCLLLKEWFLIKRKAFYLHEVFPLNLSRIM